MKCDCLDLAEVRALLSALLRMFNSAGTPPPAIPDPAHPSWDPAPKLGHQLEFCSVMSLLVITHHDSYKYAFKTFPFQPVAVVVFAFDALA